MIPDDLSLMLYTYLVVFGGALLIYDYTLTFSMEVERFWIPHKVSATTALFFVNRYAGLLGYLPILYQFLSVVDRDICLWAFRCHRFQEYAMFYAYLVLGSTAGLMLIRVYALYNRGSFVLWTMGAFLVLSIILNVILRWLGVVQDDVPKDAPPPPRCVPYRSFQEGQVSAAVWTVKPVFDLAVLLLTIRKSSKFKQAPRPILVDVLIADGIIYFVASLALNALSISFCLWAPPFLRTVGTPLNAVICPIMATRMTLNLRDPDIIPHPAEILTDSTHGSDHLVSTILSLGHPSYGDSLMGSRSEIGDGAIALRRMGNQGAV